MTCVFCPDNWDNLDAVEGGPVTMGYSHGRVLIIRPLDPVTPGHVLLIHEKHGQDFTSNYDVARDLAANAARYTREQQTLHGTQFNIITSIGPAATQTVLHTHLHVVPRVEGDGLPLPWTPQHEAKALAERRRKAEEALWP